MSDRKAPRWGSPTFWAVLVVIALLMNGLVHVASLGVMAMYGAGAAYSGMGPTSGPGQWKASLDLASGLTTLICLVVVFWIVRVCRNARLFRPGLKTSPLGAIGWYLVPFASLYKPYESMSEIWSASVPAGESAKGQILNWWWGLFLLNGFVSVAGNSAREGAPDVWAFLEGVSDLLIIVSSVVFLSLVLRLSRMQVVKHRTWSDADVFGPAAGEGVLERVNA